MVVQPGEKLPATYLERFDPAENVTYRLSVLAVSAIAVEFHWVDIPSKNLKGSYQCIQGACCQALGRRSQTYHVPIYVYRNPQQSTEGDILHWQMTPARWKKFSDLALQVDLTKYDLMLTAQKRGLGMDLSYSVVPDVLLRQYWTPEQNEQMQLAVESFYQMGESSFINTMNYNEWNQLLYEIGYDLQNQCWPGGQSPMNSGSAFKAIGSVVGSPALPPAPPTGFSPVQGSVPNVQGGVVFQPPAPAPGAVPGGMGGGVPLASIPLPNVRAAVPQMKVMGTGQVPPVSTSMGAVPQVNTSVPAPGPFQPINSAGVPLGTAPVVPQSVVAPQVAASNVPPVPASQNEVPGVVAITSDELNQMLDD